MTKETFYTYGDIIKYKTDSAEWYATANENFKIDKDNEGESRYVTDIISWGDTLVIGKQIKHCFLEGPGTGDIKAGDYVTNAEGNLKSFVDMVIDDKLYMTKRNEKKSNELIIYTKKIFNELYAKGERKLNWGLQKVDIKKLEKALAKLAVIGWVNDSDCIVKYDDLSINDTLRNGRGTAYKVLQKKRKYSIVIREERLQYVWDTDTEDTLILSKEYITKNMYNDKLVDWKVRDRKTIENRINHTINRDFKFITKW